MGEAEKGVLLLPVIASHNFLGDLAIVLCVAALTTVIFQSIRQPVVVGYLIAGMIVGPHVPIPLLADQGRIHTLSELGVILLMFALGMEFSIRRLLRLGPTSGFITALQVGLMLWLGYMCGHFLGWTTLESIFTGALLSISSTTIVAKVFEENQAPERLRELVFAVLLTEDLVAVVELAILTALASGSGLSAKMVGFTVGRLALFLALLMGIGWLVVPRVIRMVARFERAETLLVASIGICFAFAIVAEHAGYSVALGAFLAGSLVAESGEGHQVEQLIMPVRDMFAAVFFVSVGMMLDPRLVAAHWVALVVLVAAVTLGKIFGVTVGAMLVGSGPKLSIEAGMSLAQIGEFSFIIAGLALELHAAREFLYSLAVAVSVITTFATPYLVRASGPVAESFQRRIPRGFGLFDAIYDSLIDRITATRAASQAEGATIRRSILVSLSSAVLIAAVLIGTEVRLLPLAQFISSLAKITFEQAEVVAGVVAILACFLPALGLYTNTRRLAQALAARAVPQSLSSLEGGPPGLDALIEIMQVAMLIVVTILLLAIVQPVLDPIDGVVVLVLAAAAICLVTWRGVRRTLGQVRDAARLLGGVRTIFGAHSVEAFAKALPGLGPLSPVRLEPGSAAIGKTIGELGLRSATGAVVVAIGRDQDGVIIPAEAEVLRENDVLGLAGPNHAVREAVAILAPIHSAADSELRLRTN